MPYPDEYSSITSDDPRSGLLTASQLQARRQIAAALATRNRPYPKTIGEGLTAFGEGLGEGFYNRNLERAEAAQRQIDAAAMRGPTGAPATPPPAPGGASLEGDGTQALALAAPDTGPVFDPSSCHRKTGRSLSRREPTVGLRCRLRNGNSASRAMKAAVERMPTHWLANARAVVITPTASIR